MQINITPEQPGAAGFISWKRLAEFLFPNGGEIRADEHIVRLDVGERGINYFVVRDAAPGETESGHD